MAKLNEHVETFLKQRPDVKRAMERWATSSAKYEEAMQQFMQMPRIYSSASTATVPPPTQPSRGRR